MYVFGGRHEEEPWDANNELWALDLSNKSGSFCLIIRGFYMETVWNNRR